MKKHTNQTSPLRGISRGFTLVEIMIVVVILGILSAVAIPSYFRYVTRTSRGDAATKMDDAARFMQAFYSANFNYQQSTTGTAAVLPTTLTVSPLGATGTTVRYTISLTTPARNAFLITATPQNAQTTDECGTLTIDQNGQKTTQRGTVATCWK